MCLLSGGVTAVKLPSHSPHFCLVCAYIQAPSNLMHYAMRQHTQWEARGESPGESPAKGQICQGLLSDEMERCEVTQTLRKALFIYTMLPFIRQHALEVPRLNKVLQSSSGLKRLKKLAIQMIPTKCPLSIKVFVHSFVHLFIPLFNKYVFI